MANSIQVLTFITREMLRQVKNNLQFIRNISGEEFGSRFTEAPKKGETIKIRKPTRYVGRTGEQFSEENYIERTVSMVVQETSGVDLLLTNRELMFSLDDIAERVVKPAAETLASIIDTRALELATKSVANFVGTPASVPTALKTYNQARALMSWEGCPQDSQHSQLITPDMQVEIVDTLKGLFHDGSEVEKQFQSGMMGRGIGAKWYECQNNYAHTVGALGGTPLVNGANQSGTSLVTDGWTASVTGVLKAGDIITCASSKAVNPWTRKSTGALRLMVVTADVDSDGSGNATIPIQIVGGDNFQGIVPSGPFQNVTQSPADNDAILIFGSASAHAGKVSPQGLRFHKDAFVFASFDQPEPGGVEFVKSVSDSQVKLKARFIRDWDTKANKQINRFDVVWAFGIAFPEFAARICS